MDQFAKGFKIVSSDPLHNSHAENPQSQALILEGAVREPLQFQNEQSDVDISVVIVVKREDIKAVRTAYYSLDCKLNQIAPGQQILPCLLSISDSHVQQNASYDVGIGCSESRDDKAIDVARKQICSVHQTGYQFAIGQRWNKDQFTRSTNISGNFQKDREPSRGINQGIIKIVQAWHLEWRGEFPRNKFTQEITKRQSQFSRTAGRRTVGSTSEARLEKQPWSIKQPTCGSEHILNQCLGCLRLSCKTLMQLYRSSLLFSMDQEQPLESNRIKRVRQCMDQ
ncbi:hypothetical protein PGTUg99_017427 [Puccinia graminis f. sp. tritici]|uniref:Uncharacterized protein n=1 Tax=Puccinia graminis f. sp. tritici TaxID=56615 RepID=A0A5B0PDE4_PUCGR|nr:hypothetical protein PGTUg99_017427 [Puccinia graminis f. sp. tritici]